MKFTTAATLLSLLATTSAFAPSTTTLQRTSVSPQVAIRPATTELNLFGFGKAKKFNKAAKIDGEITPKEVRALFELWNAALATGDSRIVASRYTKVRSFRMYEVLFSVLSKIVIHSFIFCCLYSRALCFFPLFRTNHAQILPLSMITLKASF